MGFVSDQYQGTDLMIETTLRRGNGKKRKFSRTYLNREKEKMVGGEGDTCYCKIFLLMNLRATQHDNFQGPRRGGVKDPSYLFLS